MVYEAGFGVCGVNRWGGSTGGVDYAEGPKKPSCRLPASDVIPLVADSSWTFL